MAQTHFGFDTVDETDKAQRVRGVFDSVATRYDVMNDVMSMGLHRVWKAYTVAVANLRPGDMVLDIAGGTGDLARAFARKVGDSGLVMHTDINEAMLRTGRDRLLDELAAYTKASPRVDGGLSRSAATGAAPRSMAEAANMAAGAR